MKTARQTAVLREIIPQISNVFRPPRQRSESLGQSNGQRMAIDVTDIAHSDRKLVEIVESMGCGYLSPPH